MAKIMKLKYALWIGLACILFFTVLWQVHRVENNTDQKSEATVVIQDDSNSESTECSERDICLAKYS